MLDAGISSATTSSSSSISSAGATSSAISSSPATSFVLSSLVSALSLTPTKSLKSLISKLSSSLSSALLFCSSILSISSTIELSWANCSFFSSARFSGILSSIKSSCPLTSLLARPAGILSSIRSSSPPSTKDSESVVSSPSSLFSLTLVICATSLFSSLFCLLSSSSKSSCPKISSRFFVSSSLGSSKSLASLLQDKSSSLLALSSLGLAVLLLWLAKSSSAKVSKSPKVSKSKSLISLEKFSALVPIKSLLLGSCSSASSSPLVATLFTKSIKSVGKNGFSSVCLPSFLAKFRGTKKIICLPKGA